MDQNGLNVTLGSEIAQLLQAWPQKAGAGRPPAALKRWQKRHWHGGPFTVAARLASCRLGGDAAARASGQRERRENALDASGAVRALRFGADAGRGRYA